MTGGRPSLFDGVGASATQIVVEAMSHLPNEADGANGADGGPGLIGSPDRLFVQTAARGLVAVFATDLFTGEVHRLSPEVFCGRTSFLPWVAGSFALFHEHFHPFGGVWPERRVRDVRCQFELWQFRHALEEDWSAVDAMLCSLLSVDKMDGSAVLEWPLFGLVVADVVEAELTVKRFSRGASSRSQHSVKAAQPSDLPSETLSSREAAALLQVREQTLRRWRMEGKGPPWAKVGEHRVVYRRADLTHWLELQTTR